MARWAPELKDQLAVLAEEILHNYGQGRTVVAVDGRHGAGQGAFADALASMLDTRGITVFRAQMADFFRPRAYRQQLGPTEGSAHYRRAYDYSLLGRVLLDPFRTAGSTGFVLEGFDEERDQPVFQPKWMSAGPDAILVLSGVFLHRPELEGVWHYSIWLETPASGVGSDEAYLSEVDPDRKASAVIDNGNPDHPRRIFADSG